MSKGDHMSKIKYVTALVRTVTFRSASGRGMSRMIFRTDNSAGVQLVLNHACAAVNGSWPMIADIFPPFHMKLRRLPPLADVVEVRLDRHPD